MVAEQARAAALRKRAAELLATIDALPAEKQQEAQMQYRALLRLADVEDWVAASPKPRANLNYQMTSQSPQHVSPGAKRRGRKIRSHLKGTQ